MRRQINGQIKEQSTEQKEGRERKGWKGKEEDRRMIHLGHWTEKFYLRTAISRE